MGELIIAGESVADLLGSKFVNFLQPPYWDATFEGQLEQNGVRRPGLHPYSAEAKNKGLRRYSTRPALRRMGKASVSAAQAVIRKFILHHDGVNSSAVCWNVLHNERGLSCHFLIDNDGTVYQTLDLALMGFHAAKYNVDSIGVEFCNRGIIDGPNANYYDNHPFPHKLSEEYSINGHKRRSWEFTDAQYESFYELSKVLVRVLPNLALEYPRDPQLPTKAAWGTLGPVDALGDSYPASSFAGFMGHYHLTTRKWDPGPFDFKKWIDKLRGQRVFPVTVAGVKNPDKPVIPEDPAQLPAAIQPYYDANEINAGGGFFPVGPFGVTRLWHGGVHLPAAEGAPVYAPFAGRVIAARMGGSTPIGSNNFVLMRHDLSVASQAIRVYSLFMHLQDETGTTDGPAWMAAPSRDLDDSVEVRGYDVVVDAGAVIGRVGTVGPDDLAAPQVHVEIFSTQRWFDGGGDPAASPWKLVDGSATGRFCEDPLINGLIDRDKDGRMSRGELRDYYAGPDKAATRDLITLHVSEWSPEPDWKEELTAAAAQFKKKSPKRKGVSAAIDDDDEDLKLGTLIDEQLAPFTWWTEKVASGLGLPVNGTVFHYHPIRFIEYANSAHKHVGGPVAVTGKVLDDNDDVAGEFGYVEEPPPPPPDLHFKLENLVDGYAGDPDKKP